jgi:hypothetical protein
MGGIKREREHYEKSMKVGEANMWKDKVPEPAFRICATSIFTVRYATR